MISFLFLVLVANLGSALGMMFKISNGLATEFTYVVLLTNIIAVVALSWVIYETRS